MDTVGAVSTYVLQQGLDHTTGRVHSVFRTSLNIEVNGFLLHVGGMSDPLSCLGISLPDQEVAQLLAVTRVGDLVVFRSGTLRLYAQTRVVRVDLNSLDLVSTKVPVLGESWSRRTLEKALQPVEIVSGTGLVPSADLSAALRVLSRVAMGCDDERLDHAVMFLMGRGLGLTPSGDDILMGFGTALGARGLTSVFDGRNVASSAVGRTTDVSIAYLRAMADGYANEDFVSLVRSLRDRDDAVCRSAVARILSVGHTSGHDSLLGFIIGMGLFDLLEGPLRNE